MYCMWRKFKSSLDRCVNILTYLSIFKKRLGVATLYRKMLPNLCTYIFKMQRFLLYCIVFLYCIVIFGFSLQMSDTLIQFYKMRVGYFYGAQVDQIDFSSIQKVFFRCRLVTIICGSRTNPAQN
jgi:hypothetical protein